jgi:hypothetical protein
MSVITFPSALKVSGMSWGQQRRDLSYGSIFGSQAVEVATPLWVVSIQAPPLKEIDSGAWKAYLMQLRGKTNQAELWDMLRQEPRGTMRGTMTLNSAAAQGAVNLSIIATGENGKTLVEGDLLGFGSGITQQVVMVIVGGTADINGIINVTVEAPLRNAFSIGSAVTWNKPKALFRVTQAKFPWEYGLGQIVTGFALDLIEDWRAS